MSIKYAVQLYSVRDEIKKDLWGTLRKIKKMGYDAVEFFSEYFHTAQEIKAALKETGLVCCGWHTSWNFLSHDKLMSTITYNKVLGNADIVVPSLPKEMTSSKDAWLKTADAFNKMADTLIEYGMYLGYHNHHEEFKKLGDDTPFHYFFDNTDSRIGMQFDNGNAFHAGPEVDVYEPITRYPNRSRTLHLKPYSLKTGYETMLGEDDIDWLKFINLSEANQQINWYIVEYECDKLYSQFDGIEKCINNLKKILCQKSK